MQATWHHNQHLHIGGQEQMMAVNEAIDLNNEGMQLMKQGRYEAAHDKLQRSMQIKELLYGHDNSMVALSLMNLGDNYLNWGKLDLAEKAGKEALRIRTAIGDPEARYAKELLDDISKARKKATAAAAAQPKQTAAQPEQTAATKPSKQAKTGSSSQAAEAGSSCNTHSNQKPTQCAACGAKGVSKSSRSTPADDEVLLRRCARCRSAYYCSKECQVRDWPTHKLKCKAAEGI